MIILLLCFIVLIILLTCCLFIYLFICLFVCLFDYFFICLFVCLFIYLFIYLFVYLFIYLFVCLFVCLFVYLFIYLLFDYCVSVYLALCFLFPAFCTPWGTTGCCFDSSAGYIHASTPQSSDVQSQGCSRVSTRVGTRGGGGLLTC